MLRTILTLSLILFSTHLHAETYKWVDDNGILNFSDRPATNPAYLKNMTIQKDLNHFPEGPRKINISIITDNFIPIEMAVTARHNPDHKISLFNNNPFKELKLPKFQGKQQYFGSLQLGTNKNRLFPFVIDLIGQGQSRCYVDVNQNNNLTDESDIFTNKGQTLFAFNIAIPFQSLTEKASFFEEYKLWLYTNASLWEKHQVRYYSRTQLKSYVDLGVARLDAYLVDFDKNDANFSNDGICLDIDKNKKIKFQSECFLSSTPVIINDEKYIFKVSW